MTHLFMRIVATTLVVVLGTVMMMANATSSRPAARSSPLVLKFGALGSGSEHDFTSYPIRSFIAEVEEKTGGMVQFQYFSAGQLGGEPQMLDQIVSGSLDVGALSANVLAIDWPQLYAYNLPFAFRDIETFWKVAGGNSPFASAVRAAVNQEGGPHLVATFSGDFRGLQNNKRPVRSPDDLQGLTLRVMTGEIFTDMFRALGANTSSIPFDELYASLQRGTVDGEDLVPSTVYDIGLYEVERYMTQINMTPNVNVLVMSARAWGQLDENERQIVEAAAFNAEKVSKKTALAFEVKYPNRLEELGIEIIRHNDLTDKERLSFVDATKKVWDKYRPIIGRGIYDAYMRSLAD